MIVLTGVVLFLMFFAVIRHMHQKKSELKFKYSLYALRDKLRMLAIDGEIDSDHWLFDYTDNTISKAISQSYNITLLYVSMLATRHGEDESLNKLSYDLNQEFEKHPLFKEIKKEYHQITTRYIQDQHYISIRFFLMPIASPIIGGVTLMKKIRRWSDGLFVYPETSNSDRLKFS